MIGGRRRIVKPGGRRRLAESSYWAMRSGYEWLKLLSYPTFLPAQETSMTGLSDILSRNIGLSVT